MRLNVDLHVHTHHSRCALLKPAAIEGLALNRGLHAVAITDHNTLRGAREVAGQATRIRVIVGEEIRTTQGEITGYFLQEEIPPQRSPQQTIAAIRGQGGLVAIPHPFDRLRSSRLQPSVLEEILNDIDIIELHNSRNICSAPDARLVQRALAAGAVPIAASDAHLPVEIGRSYMQIDDFKTPAEFLRSLRDGAMVARRSPLWVHLVTKLLKLIKKKAGREALAPP